MVSRGCWAGAAPTVFQLLIQELLFILPRILESECRSQAGSGHRFSCSNYTRDQSLETDSLSRLFSSRDTTAKCVSVGIVFSRLSTSALKQDHSYFDRTRAGSGNGTRSEHFSDVLPFHWTDYTCDSERGHAEDVP